MKLVRSISDFKLLPLAFAVACAQPVAIALAADPPAQLDGNSNYTVTFAAGQVPPVNGFWSLTLYNKLHLFSENPLKRYSLGTKNKNLVKNADGSLTIYVGPNSPGKDKESNWLPSPKENISLYIRACWGKQGILDGTWKPPAVVKVAAK